MKCSSCQHENPDEFNFCMNCGSALRYSCPNCGQINEATAKFCNNCGQAFVSAKPQNAQVHPISIWSSVKRVVGLFLAGFIVTFLVLNILGILQTLSPLSGNQTAEAEELAAEFVREYYPQLADADRTTYTANVQGTDYYVVDFVLDDPSQPPVGVRILVDRLLRAVFAYEVIEG